MNKTLLSIIGVAVIVGGGAFYGGMKYAQSQASQRARSQQSGASGAAFGGRSGNRMGADFANGEIIAKDDKSITIKLRDARLPDGQGGSKIIFYSDSSEIGKFVNGTANDLEIGKTIVVNGKTNSDGSITAQSIQIRPTLTSQVK